MRQQHPKRSQLLHKIEKATRERDLEELAAGNTAGDSSHPRLGEASEPTWDRWQHHEGAHDRDHSKHVRLAPVPSFVARTLREQLNKFEAIAMRKPSSVKLSSGGGQTDGCDDWDQGHVDDGMEDVTKDKGRKNCVDHGFKRLDNVREGDRHGTQGRHRRHMARRVGQAYGRQQKHIVQRKFWGYQHSRHPQDKSGHSPA